MSNTKKTGKKGFETEEVVRSYFLNAGFFVVRGVKLRNGEDELTDIDLWLYERSATLARRRIIIDIKDNSQPRAAERLFFVKGLAEIIQVEAVGVATSDNRKSLRELARKHNILWIDNADLQRLKSSQKIASLSRLTDKMLEGLISQIDSGRSSRDIRDTFWAIKSSVADRFGPSCANLASDGVCQYSKSAIEAHPNSISAQVFTRLVYFSAAIAAAAFDFSSGDSALRPTPERVSTIANAIRRGADIKGTEDNLRWTEAAIREFVPDGSGIAKFVREQFTKALESIPADGLAEVVVKMTTTDRLFNAARDLEKAAYGIDLLAFDDLSIDAKSFLGAILDYHNIGRKIFAQSWTLPIKSNGNEIDQTVNETTLNKTDEINNKINYSYGKLL